MQIFMGMQYTIVSIDDSKMGTYNLFNFIKNQFASYEIIQNNILLTYSQENHYKHLFLIKWIYSLHKKIHNRDILNFKDLLVNRVEKPIKIITKKGIEDITKIRLETLYKNEISFQLEHRNHKLLTALSFRLKDIMQKKSYQENYLQLKIDTDEAKLKIKCIIQNKKIDGISVVFDFNENNLNIFFDSIKDKTPFFNALKLLDSKPDENIDVIKKRYKKLLIKYHPDNVYKDGIERINDYTNKFQNLQYSYELIKNNYKNI